MGARNGAQLHRAVIEALDSQLERSDYYSYQPSKDDSDYLRTLVETCRTLCGRLPAYPCTRQLLLRAASLAQVLTLNHEPDPTRRDIALRQWVDAELPGGGELAWFEASAAASAWLTILALLALASEQRCDAQHVRETYAAYLPWISLTGTMLDSYSDLTEDAESGAHSYLAHYPGIDVAVRRVGELLRRSARTARRLPNGSRHAVVVSCMAAMYLSKDSVRTPQMRPATRHIAQAGGSLTRLLMPVLRAWRVLYRQRSA